MALKTANINLYKAEKVADADQTFNIDTMLNENWDKLDIAIGEMRTEIGKIEPDIPEASTTQKGIVQLDDTINGTSKTKASTADAVRRVQVSTDTLQVKVDNPRANLVANGTFMYGLLGWNAPTSYNNWIAERSPSEAGAEVSYRVATPNGIIFLESDPFPVFATGIYHVSAEFFAEGQANSDTWIEIVAVGGNVLRAIYAASTDRWTRRGADVTIPSGVTACVIRLVLAANKGASYKGFRHVQVTGGPSAQPFNGASDGVVASDSRKHVHWGGTSTGDGTNAVGASYMVSIPGAPLSGNLPDGFTVSFIPNVVNGGGDPLLKVNNCTAYALRINTTKLYPDRFLKPGTVVSFVKAGNYFLARSAPPVGNATAAQVLEGFTFQSEAAPNGGTGTAIADISGKYAINTGGYVNVPGAGQLSLFALSLRKFLIINGNWISGNTAIVAALNDGINQVDISGTAWRGFYNCFIDARTKKALTLYSVDAQNGSTVPSNREYDLSILDFSRTITLVARNPNAGAQLVTVALTSYYA